jgi:hypothetical protein
MSCRAAGTEGRLGTLTAVCEGRAYQDLDFHGELLMTTAAVPAGSQLLQPRTRKPAMIAETKTTKAIRNAVFSLALTLIEVMCITNSSTAQAQIVSPTTTGVIAILTVKAGVTREQVMAVMPAEIRATVQLYLNGKIREWYSRGDGRGVVFLLDTRDVGEARTIIDGLPLGKENLMDHEYIAVGPLLPLRLLMAEPASQQ